MSEPSQREIPIDAVAGYFQKRMLAAEHDCLLYASQVRDLTNLARQQGDAIKQLQAKIDEMKAAKPGLDGEIIQPRSRRKAAH